MKKLLALLLVVLMTLGLMLGCAKTQTEMAAMSDESTEAPAAVEPSSTTTEAEPVTITFAEHVADIENQEAHLAKIIDAFDWPRSIRTQHTDGSARRGEQLTRHSLA